ncbi:NADH-quinone oxidoreductase subunit M [Candidatus Poribacteria bacterium]|nr:NADH-quinone oxidoreductase subunit M [Candidatus Poribacteria bacterium]MYB63111.1 NADH-quinone oxidoreductase subunit M [Candidatus Poribacteria bacterium]MYF57049.1 NADH-quinone oxidoreductase subunit M [Candidatus Poribacteria bacterium]
MLLSLVIFLPLLGVIAIALLRGMGPSVVKGIAFVISLLTFVVSIGLYAGFDASIEDFQTDNELLYQKKAWITGLGISYHIGIDGISLWLILLTTFLTPVCILATWNSVEKGLSGFMMSLLALETGMLGVFCSLDLFLFFVFWESMLIPMYFLIGIWGGERRIYATIKFVLYTMAGSALMLVGILALYFQNGNSFDYTTLSGQFDHDSLLFLAFFIAFAIKVPLFPFHTWLPDAHVEAPTVGSVILAGVLLKMGTYGIIRFCLPLFPEAAKLHTPWIVTLAVIGIIYGALVAMVQPDLKKLVAYSSVSHLGFVVLGLFSQNHDAIQGSVLQMVNHGLSTGALFLLVGMIYERRHSRMIVDFGGLAKRMPIFAAIFLIVTLSSIGLPGLNGFVGEFMILLGSFVGGAFSKWYVVFATTGVILAAVYMLWMFQRVMFGKLDKTNEALPDLNSREIAVLVPILVFIVWIGVFPNTFLKPMETSVGKVVEKVQVVPNTPELGHVINHRDTKASLPIRNIENTKLIEEEAQTK